MWCRCNQRSCVFTGSRRCKNSLPASCLVERFALKYNDLVWCVENLRSMSKVGEMKNTKWCAVWMCCDGFSHPVNFSLQILELGVLPLRKVWIYIITQNKYFGEPPDCAASVTHTPNISWMPSPPCFPLLIGQVNAKSVLLLSAIFHRFSRKYFIVHFFCLTNPNNVCVCSIPSYTWLWFGSAKWISLSFFLWLLIIQILFWHRVQEGC